MTTLVVGATGDYATFGALLTYLRGIDPLGDDYTILVQDGTYNEQVDWDIDHGGHAVYLNALTPEAAILDGQATRTYCLNVTGGALKVWGIRFEDPTSNGVEIGGAVVGASEFRNCSFYRCKVGIEDANNDSNLLVQACYFEDMDDKGVGCWSDGTGKKEVVGCWFHWTATGPTADFAIEMDGGGYAITGSRVAGCRVTTDDATKGPAHAFFGADFQVDQCRVINPRGSFFRQGWGSTFLLTRSLAKATAGSCYHGVYSTGGTAWTILRCLFMGAGRSYTGVRVTGGSTVTIKNCGFHGLSGDSGVDTDAGTTVNNSYNGFWNCATTIGGAGTYNNPETGRVSTNPNLDSASMDGVLPPEGSSWENAGNADGLPTTGAAPDIGCEEIMPACLMES